MSYVFPTLQGQLDEQNKINIFGPQNQQQQPGAQGGQAQTTPSGTPSTNTQSTSDSGATGGSGQSSTPSLQQNRNAALTAAVGKTQNPQIFNTAQNEITTANQNLQNEANQYVQQAQNTNYKVGANDIDQYVQGNPNANDTVMGLLNKSKVVANQFTPQTDVKLSHVADIQTEPGLMKYLQSEGGDTYTSGMGAFDLAALHENPGFDLTRQQLAQQAQAVQDQAKQYGTSKTAEAQSALDANLAAAKADARNQLGDYRSNLTSQEQALADQANQDLSSSKNDYIKQQQDAARLKAINDATDPRIKKILENVLPVSSQYNPNAANYYSGQNADWRSMLSANDASKFNRIAAALGDGGTPFIAGQGAGGISNLRNFNSDNYIDALRQGAAKQKIDDNLANQNAFDQWKQGQIDAGVGNIRSDLLGKGYSDAEIAAQMRGFDPNKYANTKLNWEKYLNNDDKFDPNYNPKLDSAIGGTPVNLGHDPNETAFDKQAAENALLANLNSARYHDAEFAAHRETEEQQEEAAKHLTIPGYKMPFETYVNPITSITKPMQNTQQVANQFGQMAAKPANDFQNIRKGLRF